MITNVLKDNLSQITRNIKNVCDNLDISHEDIMIVGVTKTVPPCIVNQSIECGIKVIGENRVQEYLSKVDDYNLKECTVHFIGKLQQNKVKYIIDKVSMIESVDSLKLAIEIDKRVRLYNPSMVMDILIEVNIGSEETKAGVSPNELFDVIDDIKSLRGVRIKGLMSIVPASESKEYFEKMGQLFHRAKIKYCNDDMVDMIYLSMGMSKDYDIAIKYGANIVRIGTALYGKR